MGLALSEWHERVCEISVLSAQFYCEPKASLKNKKIMLKFFKKVRELTVHTTTWMNLKITMLNGRIQTKQKQSTHKGLHLYKAVEEQINLLLRDEKGGEKCIPNMHFINILLVSSMCLQNFN